MENRILKIMQIENTLQNLSKVMKNLFLINFFLLLKLKEISFGSILSHNIEPLFFFKISKELNDIRVLDIH